MYPKPTPREKGKTKDTREKRSSSPKWKSTEREKARWLQNRYGVEDDPTLRHLVSSTGRIGHLTGLGVDCTSALAVGEVKDRNSIPGWLKDFFIKAHQEEAVRGEHDLPAWLAAAWGQITQYAASRITKRRPVLFLSYGKGRRPTFVLEGKSIPLPDMHIIDPSHHDELVRGWVGYEAIKGILANKETPTKTLSQIQQIIKDMDV